MGFFDLASPVLTPVNNVLVAIGGSAIALLVWALLASTVSMGCYWLCSNQQKLTELKQDIKAIKTELATSPPDDQAAAMAVSRKMLGMSMRHLGQTLWPTLAAGIPVVFVIIFIANNYAHVSPQPGSQISSVLHFENATPESRNLTWPLTSDVSESAFGSGLSPVIYKHSWSDWLIGNPAGYIPAASPVSQIDLAIEPQILFPSLPALLSGWEGLFLCAMVFFSLAIKFLFRIQ